MPLLQTDWFREVLRTSPRFTIDFHSVGNGHGVVASARPKRGGAPSRGLTADEIVLLSALKSAGNLPRTLHEHIESCDKVLSQLVMDGLVEAQREGQFRSGPAVLQPADSSSASEGHEEVTRVSELALHYALAVRHLPQNVLAERLYRFNSLPRAVKQKKDAAADFADRTGIDAACPSPQIGGLEWSVQSAPGWIYFRRGTRTGGRFKIYLSPSTQDVPRVIGAFAGVVGGGRGGAFKMAFPADSLRRADKIVAYVSTFEELQETLSQLVGLALEAAVQAVPFSAPVPRAPLLSWGVDPPNLSTHRNSSWRTWLTRQVAECVHAVPAATSSDEALQYLKTALQVRDIDPLCWLPRQEFLSRRWRLDL